MSTNNQHEPQEEPTEKQVAIAFITSLDTPQLTSWLLQGCTSLDFSPLHFSLEPNPAAQLQHIFKQLDPAAKERFKAATIRAVVEWTPEHTAMPLLLLSSLAAYIRASGVLDVLRVLIPSQNLKVLSHYPVPGEPDPDDNMYVRTVAYLIGVVQGFAPLEDVQILFKRLFSEKGFERYGAQIFLGLCACDPENYPRYLPRFLQLLACYPDQYPLTHVIYELVRIVTWPRLAENLQYLDEHYAEEFLELLSSRSWSPASCARTIGGPSQLIVLDTDGSPMLTFPINVSRQTYATVKDREILRHGGEVETVERVLDLLPILRAKTI